MRPAGIRRAGITHPPGFLRREKRRHQRPTSTQPHLAQSSGLRLSPWASRTARAQVSDRVQELLAAGGLTAKAGRLVGELSHGDQRATEIMMALALKPRLLLLDEPTAGMGEQETRDVVRLIRKLHRTERLTIVLIEHDMRVIFHLADRITVLAEGSVLADGAPDAIAANDRVQAAYLGSTH